ncbi:unnamed protein product [Heligmosomoides polygyrus]|uniref:Helitron helicase-like domain-containing protein n=1 Tax=Heligmosomoides polygyrus TaxID=6339 RepID=A0A3P7WYP5_HELPZ|nr:unnamed protein product [Heligmosomoides polygyrus]
MQQLYTGTGSESIQFLKHIRNYNNSLAIASTTAQLENPRGGGLYCFKVHGQIFHRIGALRPLAGNTPQCAQMLIMDTEETAAELAGRDVNRECDRATFAVLHQLLQTVNPYVQAYRLMDEVAREEEQRAIEAQRTQRPQYVVDSWLKIEMNRLNYLRKNQKELRLDTVRGLHDYMIGDDSHDGPPGRRIILAASFTGGPRHMIAQYQDAMSIVSKYGKPDIFLTFTCNPNWREIQNNLAGGEVAAYIYVVEFQKRGLSHAHMLITLKKEWKLNTADQIDQLFSAEHPESDSDPKLFDIISKNMIHRLCGNLNPTSPCMRDGACTKRFPKSFRSDTSLNVEYRRRDDGSYVTCVEFELITGTLYPSFVMAAKAAGHLRDDTFFLQSIQEAANDHVYREWLMKIGNGEAISDENGDIQVPPPLICSGKIADAIFGDAFSGRSMDLSERAILTPRNVDADQRLRS